MVGMPYDYIVVGGGSAGCVVVNRLVEDYGARVLLLEAGHNDDHTLIRMPAAVFKLVLSGSRFVKRYLSVPQPQLGGRQIPIWQANVLGGGSSVNAMAYVRGSKRDYARWTELAGGAPWGWDELVPYFRRQEGNRRLDNEAHGSDGPWKIGDPLATAESSDRFVRALQRLGLPFAHDFNSGELKGVGFLQTAIHKGRRCSAADAFLKPVLRDPKLTVVTGARVQRVLFKGKHAIGVEYLDGSRLERAETNREVILAAGALSTPKILMLSGIGEADHLKSHGIEPIVDLPSVGENLQDHHVAILSLGARGRVGYFGEDRGMRMVKNLVRYLSFQDGPIASSGAETQAFLNLQTPGANPDIQLYCIGVPWPPFGQKSNGISLWANLVRPLSRGRVRLRSANPADEIIYDPNWLSEPEDARRLVEAMKFLRKIAATSPFKEMITEEQLPGSQVTSDEDLDRYVRETTETNYHPVGTCRMGPADDPVAVLTPELRVRGVERLRVMDASMMPEIISANTNATTMAVADRGVDIMMTDHVSAADTNVREPKKIAAII